MKGFDKLHIKSGVVSRSTADLSFSHVTTLDFGQILPAACYETIKGGEYPIQSRYFARLAPLVKPTYARTSFRTMTSFIPMYQLADDWEAWHIGKMSWEGKIPASRFIKMYDLVGFITNLAMLVTPSAPYYALADGYIYDGSGNRVDYFDLCLTGTNGNLVYFKFADKRLKYFVKILNALGYAIPSNVDLQANSSWRQYYDRPENYLSAMPLLAFFKGYNDWMSQSQRFNSSLLTFFLRMVKHDQMQTGYNSNTHCIDQNGLYYMFNALKLIYENDYFTSAWQQPNSPINSLESISGMNVPEDTFGNVLVQNNQDTIMMNTNGNLTGISARGVDLLQRFAAWIRRRNYSGSKAVQQTYSEFGIKGEDYKSNYSHVLDTSIHPIQIADVMAMAEGSNIPLGDYAGKGVMQNEDKVNFKATDFGFIIQYCWFTIRPLNSYGFDRSVLRSTPFDYYNPEFDGVGAEAISVGEFFVNPLANDVTRDYQVYGFTERYNSYRFKRDLVTGDFRNFHTDSPMNVWHSGRLLNDVRAQNSLVAQASSVVEVSPVDNEFNRIFAATDVPYDHFMITSEFTCNASLPIKSINEVADLGVGNTVVSRNGNEIN